MTRDEQSSVNRAVNTRVTELVGDRYFRVPSGGGDIECRGLPYQPGLSMDATAAI